MDFAEIINVVINAVSQFFTMQYLLFVVLLCGCSFVLRGALRMYRFGLPLMQQAITDGGNRLRAQTTLFWSKPCS